MKDWLELAFAQVVENSVAGALIGAVFLLAVGLMRRRAPMLSVVFGGLILVRLALPVVPAIGPGSFFSSATQEESTDGVGIYVSLPELRAPMESSSVATTESSDFSPLDQEFAVPLETEQVPETNAQLRGDFHIPWLEIWLGGFCFFVLVAFVRQLQFSRLIKKQGEPAGAWLNQVLRDCCRELRVRTRVRLVSLPNLSSPALCGLFRPVLIVPSGFEKTFSAAEARAVFFHELAHLRRKDLWWNWFGFLLATMHWFNPVAWLVVRQFRSDRELLCDRFAMRNMEDSSVYPATVIKVVERFAVKRCPVPGTPMVSPMFHQKSEIKQRLVMIQNPQVLSPVSFVIAVIAFSGVVFFTFPSSADDRVERERQRENVRPAPERDGVREGDRSSPEREARREGDRPSPENEFGRDRGRPSPEREIRRDGDRPHPEREMRRDGDREVSADRRDPVEEGRGIARGDHLEGRREEPRLHHLLTAAENLERAGLREDARRYREQAEKLQIEMNRRNNPDAQHQRTEQLEREVQQLRSLVGQLQRQIGELHEQLRGDGEVLERRRGDATPSGSEERRDQPE